MSALSKEILPGVHIASRIEASGWGFNTVLISVTDGLAVYSPTRRLGDEVHAQIAELGEPRHLIAPNHFHHLGLEEWRSRYPNAIVVARPQAIPRLAKRYPAIEFHPIAIDGLTCMEPAGTKNGEVWLNVSDAWIVCDAFFNVPPPVTGVTGLILRLMRAAPGLTISRVWRPVHLADRAAYQRWLLEQIERTPPRWLIPSHGDPISGEDLADRLLNLAISRV